MIRELGVEGFRKYRQGLFRRGHRLHAFVEARLLGDDEAAERAAREAEEEEDESSSNHLKSVEPRLRELSCPVALEAHVVHPTLLYQVNRLNKSDFKEILNSFCLLLLLRALLMQLLSGHHHRKEASKVT